MIPQLASLTRIGATLAINLLFLMVWGFAGLGKIADGIPAWFGEKFGRTILGRLPGVTTAFWLLAAAEILGFVIAAAALVRGEFLGRRPPVFLTMMLVWSLFVFLMLGFGVWVMADYSSTFQQFVYFGITLVALREVRGSWPPPAVASEPK